MARSAGWLKKLKKVGSFLGKGASWINKNVIKPLNPIIDTALDFIPVPGVGGAIKSVKNMASKGLDYLDEKVFKTGENKQIQDIVNKGADMLLDTQRAPRDRKYVNPFGNAMNSNVLTGNYM